MINRDFFALKPSSFQRLTHGGRLLNARPFARCVLNVCFNLVKRARQITDLQPYGADVRSLG